MFCIVSAILAFSGFLRAALFSVRLVFVVPGILNLICAIAYTMSTRSFSSHTNPSESIIWWSLAFSSIVYGVVIIFKERDIMQVLPVPFLVNMLLTVIQNLVILGDSLSEVDWLQVLSWDYIVLIF